METPAPTGKGPASIPEQALQLLQGLAQDLAHASEGGSVHGARRNIKRLRSLLRLIRGAIGEAAYTSANAQLKTAADALAGRRRAEALVIAAGKVKAPAKTVTKLKDMAQRNRDEHVVGPAAHATAQKAIAAVRAAAASWVLPESGGTLLREAFGKTYRKARDGLTEAMKSGDAEALHEARKHVIHHLHHLELLREQLKGDQARRIARLEALREVLGDLNDLEELRQLAAGADGHAQSPLREALEKRRSKLIGRAAAALKPLFGQKPHAFAKRIGAMWNEGTH